MLDTPQAVKSQRCRLARFPIVGEASAAQAIRDQLEKNLSYTPPVSGFSRHEDVLLIGRSMFGLENGQIIEGSYRGVKTLRMAECLTRDQSGRYRLKDGIAAVNVGKTAVAVAGRASWGFYHWMTEIIPRLTMLKENAFLSQKKLIMRPIEYSFQRDTIAALELKPDYVSAEVIRAKKIWIPNHLVNFAGKAQISPDVLTLSNRFASNYLLRPGTVRHSKKIYVSRADAIKRKVANEEAVSGALSSAGFECLTMTGRPLQEQIAMFRDADVIVAQHGAGLVLTMFCRPGTRVIELYPEKFVAHSPFWTIASLAELNYTMLLCEGVPDQKGGFHNSDISVDVEKLLAIL